MKPLAPAALSPRHPRLSELGGLLLLLVSVLLLLALVSYRTADPSLDTAGAEAVHNWTGRIGAALSDLLLQLEGAAAFALPLLLAGLGIGSMRARVARPRGTGWIRFAGIVLAALAVPALFAVLPDSLHLFGAIPLGGIAGTLLLDSLVQWINLPGACVLLLFALAASVYLLTAFSFGSFRHWLLTRLAFAARLRDRLRNWSAARVERRALARAGKLKRRESKAATHSAEDDPDDSPDFAIETEHADVPGLAEPAADLPIMIRRGSFAEVQEPRPSMATGWDEDAFLAEVSPPNASSAIAQMDYVEASESVTEQPKTFPDPLPAEPVQEAAPTPGQEVRFTARADAHQRPVTLTARAVTGY